MNIERIKEIKLLKTLKSTDENGKPIVWLAGQVFKPKEKSLPQSILRELTEKRRGGSIVEVTYVPEPPPVLHPEPERALDKEVKEIVEEIREEAPDVITEDIPDEKPKKAPLKLSKRVKK